MGKRYYSDVCVCKSLYHLFRTYHSPNTSQVFRFELISCFSFSFLFLSKRHRCSFFDYRGTTSASLWSEAEVQADGCHRAKINSDRKNGGPEESLCRAFALPCQLYTKAVMPGKAFHLPLHSHSGLRRSYDPLGCHRGRQNPTAGMTASVS